MTLVAPQAAHAEAGARSTAWRVAPSRIENAGRVLQFCLLLFDLEGAWEFCSGRLLLRLPVAHVSRFENPDSRRKHHHPLSLCKGGAVWIPALSAIGAGFAIGLAAIGSGVGQAPNIRRDNPSSR